MGMKVGIPKEIYENEYRVAATPDTAKQLMKLGFDVLIESGAGNGANFADAAYAGVNCKIVADAPTLWSEADIVLKVRSPQMHPEFGKHEVEFLSFGKSLISFIYAKQNPDLMNELGKRKANVVAMEAIPRISRAQKLDALSSMANLAGYRAVIEAANNFGRFFNGQITAAGKVPPAKVLVIGAGVAGLAAIGTAKGLGAIVRAFDTRLVVKEQIESLGAEFLELQFTEDGNGEGGYAKVMSDEFIKAEMELFAEQAKEVDIIITTALIPGRKAPILITQEMVESMKDGSVIVDLAAEQGGNCACTHPGEAYRYQGVTIVGFTDLPSRMAQQASQLYGTNLCHLLQEMGGGNNFHINLDDDVVRGALVLHAGEVPVLPAKIEKVIEKKVETKVEVSQTPSLNSHRNSQDTSKHTSKDTSKGNSKKSSNDLLWVFVAAFALIGIGISAPASFLSHFTVFVLACFVGWQVIWNVKPALHTPLMSVTNAISGIIIIGGMLQLSGNSGSATTILGAIAIFIGMINISGGFLVTQRMLKMFQR
jgi:H+-translocating NAD(P) transhydrogenase subunit alpha